jgi:hypothetical protein
MNDTQPGRTLEGRETPFPEMEQTRSYRKGFGKYTPQSVMTKIVETLHFYFSGRMKTVGPCRETGGRRLAND